MKGAVTISNSVPDKVCACGYDFTTVIDRRGQGASKWNLMRTWNEDAYVMGVTPLSVADMEFKMAPPIIEGLKKYLDDITLGYSVAYDEYYGAVMNWMRRRHGWQIKKDWIVNTPGVVNAFFAAVEAFTYPGDGVILFKPVYYPFFDAIGMNGRELVNCPLVKDKNNYYAIDYSHFEELAKKPENKLLLLCSPHNPVGRVWKKEELEKLAEICLRNGVTILSDEIWMDFILGSIKHTPLASISEEIANITVTCTAPSKTFNLAGMATSNIVISNEEIREAYRKILMKQRSVSVNVLGFKACEIAYNECEGWFDELLKVIDANQREVSRSVALLSDEISRVQKLPIPLSAPLVEGTYLQWMDFRGLGMDPHEMEAFMHNEAMFYLDEGYIFGDEGIGFERINLAAPGSVICDAMGRFEAALKRRLGISASAGQGGGTLAEEGDQPAAEN